MSKRLKFFLYHSITSVVIALVVIGLVFLIWYPAPLAYAVGVTHIFLMLIIIDVILGPFLAWLVYKEGKRTLKMDLSIIILIQIAALTYGVYSIAQARPVWIVFNDNAFELVRYNQIKTENVKQAQPQFQQVTWFKPQYAAVKHSENIQEQQIERMHTMLNGISLTQYPERYIALQQVKNQMQMQAQDLSTLKQWNNEKTVSEVLEQYPQADAWLPLKTYGIPLVVLMDKETAKIIKIVNLRPWK